MALQLVSASSPFVHWISMSFSNKPRRSINRIFVKFVFSDSGHPPSFDQRIDHPCSKYSSSFVLYHTAFLLLRNVASPCFCSE